MMINKTTPSLDYKQWLKRLDTQLCEPNNQNLIKVPKVINSTNKKTNYNTLGTSVINSPKSTPSLAKMSVRLR